MKKVFKTVAVALTALVMVSCGSNADSLVGTWHADVSSLDLVLGDGVPEEMKKGIESEKGEAMKEAQSEADEVSIEFTKEGKVILSKEGEDEKPELEYTVDGDKLNIKGEIDGEKVDFSLTLAEASADKFTLSITGEEALAQMKEKYPEMLAQAEGMGDLETMVKGSSVSISFKK